MVLKRLQRHRQTTLVRAYCSRTSLFRKAKRRTCGIFSPLLLIIYPLGLFSFEERIGMEFKSLPLPFRTYYHSSLSANTRQTLAVVWE